MNLKPLILGAELIASVAAPPISRDAHASEWTEPLVGKLAEIPAALAKSTPNFVCTDPTNKNSCQQVRALEGLNGLYVSYDWADGGHRTCFPPDGQKYEVCTFWFSNHFDPGLTADTLINEVWTPAPLFDQRCTVWGGPFSAEYLGCLGAVPPQRAS
jgi:hypothetical protein